MEAFTNLLHRASVLGLISKITLPSPAPPISHLLYADDVTILGLWSRRCVSNTTKLLHCFQAISGLKVNMKKSLFFGFNLTQDDLQFANMSLGCKMGQLPMTYLGLTVGTNMSQIKHWRPVIEVFEKRLSSWKAKTLSIGGRITLIKSVLDSLPSYYFSLYKAPVCVISKLESIRMSFFWGGSSSSRKIPWISWDRVIASVDSGGLGLGSLETKNLSLLTKWWWRFRSEPNSLWALTIKAIHVTSRNLSPVPQKSGITGAWSSIAKLGIPLAELDIVLQDLFAGTVGDGSSIRLWIDPWMDNTPLRVSFPDLFALERSKGCLVRDRVAASPEAASGLWNWSVRPSSPLEVDQLQQLEAKLSSISLSSELDSWSCALDRSGLFSVKALRIRIQQSVFGPRFWLFPWNRLAPIKNNVLCWRLEQNWLPTCDQLAKRSINIPSGSCPLCLNSEESAGHLFLRCGFSRTIWTVVAQWCRIPTCPPANFHSLFAWHEFHSSDPRKAQLVL